MAVKIKVPDSAYSEQEITLNSKAYSLIFKYNNSDEAWYIDILDVSGNTITKSIKVMPNQNLTGRFSYNNYIEGGDLWCFRTRSDFSPVSRDNFGVGKVYELWFLTDAEILELGYDDTVQL